MARTTFVTSFMALPLALALGGCGEVDTPYDPLVKCAMYLKMDEAAFAGAAGEVKDACGGDDNGKAIAGVTTVDNGARGRAAQFTDINTQCIEVPDSPRLRPDAQLTMSAWVMPTNLDATTAAFGVISKRTSKDVDDSYNLSLWTGKKPWVELQNSPDRFSGKAMMVNGRWTQLTVVYDGAQVRGERVRLFVDGVLDTVGAEDSPSLGGAAIPLNIGCMPGIDETEPGRPVIKQGFLGKLDDVIVWTRALSDTEVADWYAATPL